MRRHRKEEGEVSRRGSGYREERVASGDQGILFKMSLGRRVSDKRQHSSVGEGDQGILLKRVGRGVLGWV